MIYHTFNKKILSVTKVVCQIHGKVKDVHENYIFMTVLDVFYHFKSLLSHEKNWQLIGIIQVIVFS